MADEIPRHLSGYGTDEVQLKRKIPTFPTLTESGVTLVHERDFAIWLHNNPHERPPNWTPSDESRAMMLFENLSPQQQADLGPRPYDRLADMLGDGGILGAAGDDEFGMEDDAARYKGYVDDYLSEMSPYTQSQQRTQAAARTALADNEGTLRDTGLTSYHETRHPGEAPGGGTLIRASATPFYEYEYDPKAFRQAEMDTKRSEREYEEGLARKEAERTRKGKQDPAPTLGPSMTEQ